MKDTLVVFFINQNVYIEL